MPRVREIRPGIRQASAEIPECVQPLQVIALCHDTLKTPPHQFCIRFCIYAETICNIAYLNQKAKWQTVQMGSTPVAAKNITREFGCRITFYAKITTCRLFRRELWCAKAPLLETFMRRLFLHNNLTREKVSFSLQMLNSLRFMYADQRFMAPRISAMRVLP